MLRLLLCVGFCNCVIEKMNPTISGCIASLNQSIALLEKLDDKTYAETNGLPVRSSIGAHLRHCIEFYECFLCGVKLGGVNYNKRVRETLTETNRDFAITKLRIIISELELLSIEADALLFVCVEDGDAENEADWCRSTVLRELQFLLSHTTHHYALMSLMLKLQGQTVDEEFGVTPSTLKHWAGSADGSSALSV
jgi:uncharacterized damage-inducible protein DinB